MLPDAPDDRQGNSTVANGINDAGQIVGSYYFDGASHGYLYSGGTFSTVDVPTVGGNYGGTAATDINNVGQIVGTYADGYGRHGFLYSGGSYTTLDDPQGLGPYITYTVASGINDAGQIVGDYYDYDGGSWHGFLYSGGTYLTIDDPLAMLGTYVTGINNAGEIVGYYEDNSGAAHGFLATPTAVNPPIITSVSAAPSDGDLGPGNTITLTVNFSEAVTVAGGTPTLALNDGGTAFYTSGSMSSALVFTYTVGALGSGQNTSDLALAATSAINLNGATITDAFGTAADLSGANGYNPVGTLQIDTTAPTAIHWKSGISGTFETASNWSTGTVPRLGDDALIDATGTYTVTTSLGDSVHSISIAAGGTLDITGGEFDLGFFGKNTNAGVIEVHSHLSVFGTLDNTGLIECVGGPTFSPPYTSVITYLQPTGNNSNSGTIEAISGGEVGFNLTSANGPTAFANFGTIEATGGGQIVIGFTGPAPFTNFGTIEAVGKGSSVEIFTQNGLNPVTNLGQLIVDGGVMSIDDVVNGSGTALISDGGTLYIEHAGFAENTSFAPGANGILEIGFGLYADADSQGGASFTGTLSGFATGDRIDLLGINAATATYSFSFAGDTGGILSVTDGTYSTTISLAGSYVPAGFHLADDGSGSAVITYASTLFNPVTLYQFTDPLAVEMVKLAVDAYPDSPNPSSYLPHLYDPLSFGPSSKAQTDITLDGWHELTPSELLGANFQGALLQGQQGQIRYSFENGYYRAINNDPNNQIAKLGSDPSEADALVLTGLVNNQKTLAISFAGTDQESDWLDYANFATHYAKFAPLVDDLKTFIDTNQIQQVLVSGHSLGGAMVQYLLHDLVLDLGAMARGWTIGAPGAEEFYNGPDFRESDFYQPLDPVYVAVPQISQDVVTARFLDPFDLFGELATAQQQFQDVLHYDLGFETGDASYVAQYLRDNVELKKHGGFGFSVPYNYSLPINPHPVDGFLIDFNEHDQNGYYFDISRLLQPKVSDGYVAGATVFADANGNGVLDLGEASTTTDAGGAFTLDSGSAPIVAFGGTDIATGLPFHGLMAAPSGSAVVTPLTTLIVALNNQGVPDAEQNVLAAFGLDPTTDLLSLDPVAATAGGDTQGQKAFLAGTEVLDTVVSIASLLEGSNPGQFANAFNFADAVLANMILNSGASLDLTDTNQIKTLISDTVLASGSLTLDSGVVDGVVSIIADLNGAAKATGGATGVDLLSALSAVAQVAQGVAADALKGVGGNSSTLPNILDAFTGTNLDHAINDAMSQIGDVDGPAFQNPPVAHDDSYTTSEDTRLIVAAKGVLANDKDADADPLNAVLVSGPAHGDLTLNPDGSFTYTPSQDYNGPDGFTYKANDGSLDSNVATVSVTVSPVNDPPVVEPLSASLDEDGPTFSKDLLTGTSDPDQDILLVQGLDAAATTSGGRTLTIGADYTLSGSTFALTAAGFAEFNSLSATQSDEAVIHFDVSDGLVATPNTLTLTILGANDAPTVVNQTSNQLATVGTPYSLTLPADTFQDVDSGDHLTLSASKSDGTALPPWLNFSAGTGAFSGTPGSSNVGNFDLKVTATDTGNLAASETFHFTVAGTTINHPPVITSNGGVDAASVIICDKSKYVARVQAFDPDPNTTIKYSIVGGADQKLFNIDPSTGVLSFKTEPKDGHSYHVSVAASDGSLKDAQTINVKVAYGPFAFGNSGISDTFVFKPHFGLEIVGNFDANSPTHDVLELDQTLFRNTNPESALTIFDLVKDHSFQFGHDVLIITDTHDIIDLRNTNLHNLVASDFFVSGAVTKPAAILGIDATAPTINPASPMANIALLGQYMAASFVPSADGFGGTVIHDPPPATLTQMLTQPQHA